MIFKKDYTRESLLIIQEAWAQALAQQSQTAVPIIVFSKQGIMTIWENQKCIKYLLNKRCRFLDKTIPKYLNLVKNFRHQWTINKILDIKSLQKYILLVYQIMPLFVEIYFAAQNPQTPKKLLTKCRQIRDADVLFYTAIKVIRNSIIHLNPQLKGFEQMITREEIMKNKIPSKKELTSRYKNFIMIPNQKYIVSNFDNFIKKNPQYSFVFENITKQNKQGLLNGQVGYSGYANGRVKMVFKNFAEKKFKIGDILVSPMTTPEMVPLMKRAAAFITDEGGITCHAAIIARELKKPCIIGTRVATQVLKDGDRVEVDANRGIVKKI